MDTPSTTFLAGVVEGFYGRPWTPPQRRRLFHWVQQAGLNAYLYAPKDDLKHRALWRSPYSASEVRQLRNLVRLSRSRGLEFIYALAPGLDITCSSAADVAALAAKLQQIRNLGVRAFAVLWDDISAELNAADRKRYGSAAAAQVDVTHRAARMLRTRRVPVRFLFCPTVYCGRMAEPSVPDSPYLREIGRRLEPEIDVLWTGPHIISETIPVESIRQLARVIRRPPVLWDNLHANDYDMRRLYLGPYSGRSPELRAVLRGVLLNPNIQAHANYIPILTLGRYLTAAMPPSPRMACLEAVDAWLAQFAPAAGPALAREQLLLFTDLNYLPTELGEQGQRCLEDFTRILQTTPDAWGASTLRLEEACRQIVAFYDRLTALRNRDLCHALYPHAWELKEVALLMSAWLRWRRQHPEPTAQFASPDWRPSLFRGGFTALIEQLLPMDSTGSFHPHA